MAYRWWAVLPILVASVAWSQTTSPATAPATLPADTSSPKGTLRLLFNATDRGDAATIRSLLFTATPLEEKLADLMADLSAADAALRKSLKDTFGDAATKAEFGDIEASGKVRDAAVEQMPETLKGDTAIIMLQGPNGVTPMEFRKVNDGWKIRVGKSIEKADPATVEKRMAVIGIQMKATRDVTTDVLAGKHKSVGDVKQTLEARVRQALMQYVQNQTKSATNPATQPATQPVPRS